MICYIGDCPDDAADVLDSSHGRPSTSSRAPSHARGHAVAPPGRRLLRDIDCAENFSYGCMKSAFLSRGNQDKAVHTALVSDEAEAAIRNLKDGSDNESVKCDIRHLRLMIWQIFAMGSKFHARQESSTWSCFWDIRLMTGASIFIHATQWGELLWVGRNQRQELSIFRCSSTDR